MFGHKRQVPQKRLVFSLTVKHNIVDDYNNPSYRAEYSREQKIYDNLAPGRDFCVKFRKYREDNENNKNNGIANYLIIMMLEIFVSM